MESKGECIVVSSVEEGRLAHVQGTQRIRSETKCICEVKFPYLVFLFLEAVCILICTDVMN